MNRRGYTSDVSDEEWALVTAYLTLMREEAPQREYSLREVFDGLRHVVKNGPGDLPPGWAIYQQTPRWIAAGCFEAIVHDRVHMAIDTLGHLLALHVTSANKQTGARPSRGAGRRSAGSESGLCGSGLHG